MISIEMAIFALVTSASPGPVNILASIYGTQYGLKRSVLYVLGATIGFCTILAITGFGVGQLLQTDERLELILTITGSLYLLYLSYKLSKADINIEDENGRQNMPSIFQGAFLQYVNPKAWLVSMAGTSMYLQGEKFQALLLLFVSVYLIICFFSILSWVYFGYLITRNFSKKYLGFYNKGMAGLLAFLVCYNLYNTVFGL
ncbi:lysine transporter LysE [candidate division KSB3 bacterium]|uniref:Lysine transporter LysE n=1 Tax=candidate division KSB3 bacterium TaxID=2044937 RepID=A0A2G6E5U5_9BACT|nr:MAG: lysine transporter LysE [candidate division KSB3 bacterium]PIE29766.1 MAG: lysine transporter LysE [candidate division KSB3 bacterium]